eukprot:1062836-Alexandrium_andersonii.AAC.1
MSYPGPSWCWARSSGGGGVLGGRGTNAALAAGRACTSSAVLRPRRRGRAKAPTLLLVAVGHCCG